VASTRRKPPASPSPTRSETVRLPDGRSLRIRPISPADAAPIAAGFDLLTEDEVRRRYLHPVKALSPDYLQQLTRPDRRRDFVLVAAEPLPAGKALVVAVARLSRDSEHPECAEFGILVSHFVSGQGLGRLLMQRLLDWASRHAIREVYGDVLYENSLMLNLAGEMGFERVATADASGLVRVRRLLR
jgi:GNAT superfamily N-acetyltransferase